MQTLACESSGFKTEQHLQISKTKFWSVYDMSMNSPNLLQIDQPNFDK